VERGQLFRADLSGAVASLSEPSDRIAVYAIATDEAIVLRVAMVVALIVFVDTIAFAYY
jgi:hypothetical protein